MSSKCYQMVMRLIYEQRKQIVYGRVIKITWLPKNGSSILQFAAKNYGSAMIHVTGSLKYWTKVTGTETLKCYSSKLAFVANSAEKTENNETRNHLRNETCCIVRFAFSNVCAHSVHWDVGINKSFVVPEDRVNRRCSPVSRWMWKAEDLMTTIASVFACVQRKMRNVLLNCWLHCHLMH